MPNRREGSNKRAGWADFFVYDIKNSGEGEQIFPFIT